MEPRLDGRGDSRLGSLNNFKALRVWMRGPCSDGQIEPSTKPAFEDVARQTLNTRQFVACERKPGIWAPPSRSRATTTVIARPPPVLHDAMARQQKLRNTRAIACVRCIRLSKSNGTRMLHHNRTPFMCQVGSSQGINAPVAAARRGSDIDEEYLVLAVMDDLRQS